MGCGSHLGHLTVSGERLSFRFPVSSENKVIPPLSDASTSEIDTLVDEVLRSGKHHALPAGVSVPSSDPEDRLHAKVIAGQMQRLAHQLSADGAASDDGPDDVDEWWFELDEKRIGPISLRKVRYLWEEGELTPDSLCWHEGFSSWVSLFQVSELAEALAPRSGGGLTVASRIERAREESSGTSWKPTAGAALESDNRKRLKEAHPLGLSEEREAANDDRTVDSYVGTHTTLPALQQPAAAPPRVGFAHSLVSGLVAGVVVAAAVIGARVFWPEHAPQQPVVVVVRDEPKSPPPKLTRPTPAREEAKTREPAPAPKPATPKPAAKVVPKPEPVTPVTPAVAEPPKPETVDEQFAKAFTPPDELETSEIFEVVANHQAQVDACVQAQKAASPELSGRVVMRWNVALDGSVSDVTGPSGDFADAPITACLAKAIAGWKFPKHEVAHGPVDVPFVL